MKADLTIDLTEQKGLHVINSGETMYLKDAHCQN